MKRLTHVERGDAIEEIDNLIERELDEAMGAALNREGPLNEPAEPYWSALAEHFRRGAELADSLAGRATAPNPPGGGRDRN